MAHIFVNFVINLEVTKILFTKLESTGWPSYEPSWLAVLGTRRKNKIHSFIHIARLLKNGRGNIESRKFKVITKIFSRTIYFNANLERFTKFSNHEALELYGIIASIGNFTGERNLFLGNIPESSIKFPVTPDFVSQLCWRKIGSCMQDKIRTKKPGFEAIFTYL